ncbi:MAG TPA: gamma-glutamyltransferase, partial [Gemmatimonadales bacterium]|nr:gamma-glutamyltransferase [Gemmatimonadales bacterium]
MPIRRTASLLFFAALAAAPLAAQEYTAGIPMDWPMLGRSRVTEAPSAMVVSGHPVASEVGRDILKRGGNAIDAAVAVAFALAVVHPEAGNIGGGGFLLYRRGTGQAYGLDFRERAPGRATPTMYLGSEG